MLSASPALSAVGLWMPNCGSGACENRKLFCGVLSLISTVVGSIAVTETRLEFSAQPKTAPK